MNKLKMILIALVAVVLAGCQAEPARNYNFDLPPGFSMEQVEKAIIKSGESRSWEMKKAREGLITGKMVTYDHTAEIRIPYSTSQYSIQYVNSQNLKGDESRIPDGYNRWVLKLSETIHQYLGLKR